MRDNREHSMDAARLLRRATLGFVLLFLLTCVIASAQPRPTEDAGSDHGCGTMDTPFAEHKCQRLVLNGEVSAGQAFERKIGGNLLFRLNPKTALSGWTIEVISEHTGDPAHSEYVWVVNPPYRSFNTSFLDTSYGIKAKDAVAYPPREFNFVLTEDQFKRAADLVEILIMSRPLSDKRPQEEIDKEWNMAREALARLPVAKGRLTIADSRVADSAGKSDLGSIDWLKFEVELHVPCGFAANKSSEIVVDTTPCSVAEKDKQK